MDGTPGLFHALFGRQQTSLILGGIKRIGTKFKRNSIITHYLLQENRSRCRKADANIGKYLLYLQITAMPYPGSVRVSTISAPVTISLPFTPETAISSLFQFR